MNVWRSPAETADKVRDGLARRRRREWLFRSAGALATAAGIVFLAAFLASLAQKGASAFRQTYVQLDVELDPEVLSVDGVIDPERADVDALVRSALNRLFPDVSSRGERRALYRMISIGAAFEVRRLIEASPELVGTTQTVFAPLAASFDSLVKGNTSASLPESQRSVSNRQLQWLQHLEGEGRLESRFNTNLLLNGDSREPELAGVYGALVGSFFMMLVTATVSFPLGIAAAVYLEEFAPRNRWTDIIEVNINNLAAVPSIIFGLLGLAVFIDLLGLPRSAPLVGGLVLSLLTLPVIIISARAAIASVPASIRDGALALGASKMQVVFDHVFPLALPGMLTGGIIGLSRALGETAPLLMIGMVAFIVDIPDGITDPSTALPVQIFLWADSPERAFAEHTAAAILVLLSFLLLMNLGAVIIRRRLQRNNPG